MGLIGGAGLSRFIATQLYQVTATDPLTHVTSYTCDTCGSLLRRTDPLCRHVNHQHDAREAFP